MREKCVHHWLIAQAEGETSPGRCKLCGEVRMFKNSVVIHGPWSINPTADDVAHDQTQNN